jgi:hypothetical protein
LFSKTWSTTLVLKYFIRRVVTSTLKEETMSNYTNSCRGENKEYFLIHFYFGITKHRCKNLNKNNYGGDKEGV